MIRTSVTIDEAVGALMGWVEGPVVFEAAHDATQEEINALDGLNFLVSDELEQLAAQAETELVEARLEGMPAKVIAEKQAAVTHHAEVERQARALYCAVRDELNKGEMSLLRVDAAESNEHLTYITLTSLDEWAKQRFGRPILAAVDRLGQPEVPSQKIVKAPRVKQLDQEAAIQAQIRRLGYDPLALPKNASGKSGVKSAVRNALSENPLFRGKTTFGKAWDRLREEGRVKDAS